MLPVLLLALLPTADAAQMRLSRPQLCGLSTLVVVAEVTTEETRWSAMPDGGIERAVWLAPSNVVRGKAGASVEILLPGGTIGETTQWVEDVPNLEIDGTYLLFLVPTNRGFQIIGGEQGAIRVGPGHEPIEAAIASVGDCPAP